MENQFPYTKGARKTLELLHGYTNRCFQKRQGAALGNQEIGGRWTDDETANHINILELQAPFFAFKAFCHTTSNTHVQLQIDNTTAVAYITNMGGSKFYHKPRVQQPTLAETVLQL